MNIENTTTDISPWKLLSGIAMVFGTAVGAGMLGIPALMGGSDFVSVITVTVLVWVFMLSTGLLLSEAILAMPSGSNLLSLSARFLGAKGKWIAGGLFFFLYYCLLVAYFSGGAPLFGEVLSFLGIQLSFFEKNLVFLGVFGGIIALGARAVGKINFLFTGAMFISYACLIGIGGSAIRTEAFSFTEFSFVSSVIPVLFSAFGFHNIIPTVTRYFERDRKAVRTAIWVGTLAACIFYLIWIAVVLGSVPKEALIAAKKAGLPVTYALQAAVGSRSLYLPGQMFAFFALTTSFLGVGLSFVDFLRDGFREKKKNVSKGVCVLLTFLPPFISVLIDPSLFETALGVAGGFGEAILNGLLPIAIFWSMRSMQKMSFIRRLSLLALAIFGIFVVGIEVLTLCGNG